jgi:beta-aspartyl-peptidase (threonine type)
MIIRFMVSIVCAAVLAINVSGGANQKKAPTPREATEIQAVLDRQVKAWNRRDLEGFMQGYWNSDRLSFYSNAAKTSGWQATIDRYRNRYQSEGREMGQLEFTDLQIEVLGNRAAFVRGRWHLKMKDNELGGLFTLIFRKLQGRWQIVHDHTGSA